MRGVEVPVPTSSTEVFPSPETLLRAIRGHLDNRSPVTVAARQLGVLFRALIADPGAGQPIRAQIGVIAGEIDCWVCGQLPKPKPGAYLVTDSVGGVIARLAEASEFAWWALMHHPPADIRVHRCWDHLAEMRNAYAAFAEQVAASAIAVPKAWPGIETMGRELTK